MGSSRIAVHASLQPCACCLPASPAPTPPCASLSLQNSNLVLTAETRTRDAQEPSGEPESLFGRMRGKMGDRVQYNKPEGYDERKEKAAKKWVCLHLGGALAWLHVTQARCCSWRGTTCSGV